MKTKLLLLIFLVLFLSGCGSKYNESVTESCDKAINELEYYLDGKTDAQELSGNLGKYSGTCEAEEGNISESNICITLSTLSIKASLSNINGEKNYVEFEKDLKELKKMCK